MSGDGKLRVMSSKVEALTGWTHSRPIGAGLNNLGNTCFLNSVIQSLTYTPAFANLLLSQSHSSRCKMQGFCMFCVFERHVMEAITRRTSRVITPSSIVNNLRNINKRFRLGRQEDAHEFLRYVIESLQKGCAQGHKLDPKLAESTIIHKIFGGNLRSQVKCTSCQYESNKYDPFLDLSLEIDRVDTVEKALRHFTAKERLDGSNKYKCSGCRKLVVAEKRFTIHDPPVILTIQLKRFSFLGHMGGKINKPISFSENLVLGGNVLSEGQQKYMYQLCAVIVHIGSSTNSGHYFCFVRNSNQQWYQMDDSSVRQVNVQTVLNQRAYILIYERVKSTRESVHTNGNVNNGHANPSSNINNNINNRQSNSDVTMADANGANKNLKRPRDESIQQSTQASAQGPAQGLKKKLTESKPPLLPGEPLPKKLKDNNGSVSNVNGPPARAAVSVKSFLASLESSSGSGPVSVHKPSPSASSSSSASSSLFGTCVSTSVSLFGVSSLSKTMERNIQAQPSLSGVVSMSKPTLPIVDSTQPVVISCVPSPQASPRSSRLQKLRHFKFLLSPRNGFLPSNNGFFPSNSASRSNGSQKSGDSHSPTHTGSSSNGINGHKNGHKNGHVSSKSANGLQYSLVQFLQNGKS